MLVRGRISLWISLVEKSCNVEKTSPIKQQNKTQQNFFNLKANIEYGYGKRPFPNLIFFQTLLFHLYLRKFVNDLVIYP